MYLQKTRTASTCLAPYLLGRYATKSAWSWMCRGRDSILSHRICVIVLFQYWNIINDPQWKLLHGYLVQSDWPICVWKVHSTCFGYRPSLAAGRSSWDHNNVWVVMGTDMLTSAVFTYLVVHMPWLQGHCDISNHIVHINVSWLVAKHNKHEGNIL